MHDVEGEVDFADVLGVVNFARASEAFSGGSEGFDSGIDDVDYVHDGDVCCSEIHHGLLHVALRWLIGKIQRCAPESAMAPSVFISRKPLAVGNVNVTLRRGWSSAMLCWPQV